MSNLRDGGYIIIGVEKNDYGKYEIMCMDDYCVGTYEQEKVLEAANVYADPYVDIDLKVFKTEKNNSIVVIKVFEFAQVPVICKHNYERILEQGRIYTRTFRKPESTATISSPDLREIIDLALEKESTRIRRILSAGNITKMQDADKMYETEREEF